MIVDTWTLSKIEERELSYIVGRERELHHFTEALTVGNSRKAAGLNIIHVYGTGGVGKSTFLRLCRKTAYEAGAAFAMVDSRDFEHHGHSLAAALHSQLPLYDEGSQYTGREQELTTGTCLSVITQISQNQRVVLAIDTFEEMADMEDWLRDCFLPFLPDGTLVLLAGRHPLRGKWRLSPAWRERITSLPLVHLERCHCFDYLTRCGIRDEARREWLWRRTKGHPLSLSLAAAAAVQGGPYDAGTSETDYFEEMAMLWMKEVPDQELRTVTEAASVLRHFDLDRLSFILDSEISPEVFERLISLSFVRKSVRGWQLHDLMSESILKSLKDRSPASYKKIKDRCVIYYADTILANSGQSNTGWEVGELFHHAGNQILRVLGSREVQESYYWVTVTESNFKDVLSYIRWRQTSKQTISGVGVDPESGESFHIEYSSEAIRQNVPEFDPRTLFELEPEALRLLKDSQGRTMGLSVIVPIHSETILWLQNDPYSSPYLASLTQEELEKLKQPRHRPAGWFMRSIDFVDLLDLPSRTQGLNLLYEHVCAGGLFFCSPYPARITDMTYPALGFCEVKNACHTNYDGKTPTATYVLDTRGDKLRSYLASFLRKAGVTWPLADQVTEQSTLQDTPSVPQQENKMNPLKQLTKREQEVAELVIAGCSNAEAANKLYISEVTVKKHLKAIYAKLGINSRLQLANLAYTRST